MVGWALRLPGRQPACCCGCLPCLGCSAGCAGASRAASTPWTLPFSGPPPNLHALTRTQFWPFPLPQRDCYERLYEAAGGSVGSTAQRDFMLAWDWHLQRNPLHADADVPSSLRQFKAAAAPTGDAAFHRQFAVMVTNLWRYRLLTPDQAYELLQA